MWTRLRHNKLLCYKKNYSVELLASVSLCFFRFNSFVFISNNFFISLACSTSLCACWTVLSAQEVHSNRHKQPETAIKRSINAWIFIVRHRNLWSRIMGRFFARKRSSFFTLFIYYSGMTDYGDVFTPVLVVLHHFQPFRTVYVAVFLDLGASCWAISTLYFK
jgi:hypothetical protein